MKSVNTRKKYSILLLSFLTIFYIHFALTTPIKYYDEILYLKDTANRLDNLDNAVEGSQLLPRINWSAFPTFIYKKIVQADLFIASKSSLDFKNQELAYNGNFKFYIKNLLSEKYSLRNWRTEIDTFRKSPIKLINSEDPRSQQIGKLIFIFRLINALFLICTIITLYKIVSSFSAWQIAFPVAITSAISPNIITICLMAQSSAMIAFLVIFTCYILTRLDNYFWAVLLGLVCTAMFFTQVLGMIFSLITFIILGVFLLLRFVSKDYKKFFHLGPSLLSITIFSSGLLLLMPEIYRSFYMLLDQLVSQYESLYNVLCKNNHSCMNGSIEKTKSMTQLVWNTGFKRFPSVKDMIVFPMACIFSLYFLVKEKKTQKLNFLIFPLILLTSSIFTLTWVLLIADWDWLYIPLPFFANTIFILGTIGFFQYIYNIRLYHQAIKQLQIPASHAPDSFYERIDGFPRY